MGQKARARAARRVATTSHPDGLPRQALDQLHRVNVETAKYFAGDAMCVEAAALFVRTAADLGIEVRPQPVALAAQYDDYAAILGRRALDAFGGDLSEFAEVTDELEGTTWDTAGHMVVVHEDSRWMFDPTLGQLSPRLRVELGPLAQRVPSLKPEDGAWHFSSDELGLRYYLCDDDTTWVAGYEHSYEACRLTAGDRAGIIRSGRPGVTVRERPDPR